jgi:hypothetical protein
VEQSVFHSGSGILSSPKWLDAESAYGKRRATHPRVAASGLSAGLVRMVGGQRSPWHGSGGWPEFGRSFPPLNAGGIFYLLEGELDFRAYGCNYVMTTMDTLLVNAVIYSYSNPGFVDALMWNIEDHPAHEAPITAMDGPVWTGDPAADGHIGSHPYYDGEPEDGGIAVVPDARERVSLICWHDVRHSEITWCGEDGTYWGAYPAIEVGFRARHLRVPPRQAAHLDQTPAGRMLFNIDSSKLEVSVDGKSHALGRADVITPSAGAEVVCANPGLADALLLEVTARV